MTSPVLLQKEDMNLPDNYHVKIVYVTGKTDELELASHFYNKDSNILELWTKDNLCSWIPMDNVQRLEFDKSFSKIVEIRRKLEREKNDTTK